MLELGSEERGRAQIFSSDKNKGVDNASEGDVLSRCPGKQAGVEVNSHSDVN